MDDARDLIAAEADAAEESRHEPLPADAVGTRRTPGTPPKVLSVRLDAEVFADLSSQAERLGIPVSTLARMLIVQGLGAKEAQPAVPETLELLSGFLDDRIRHSVRFELSHLVRPEFLREPT
ncbi:hypothetical protein GCM10023216_23410 [Isoptericola chiayiensis]|uniref:Ribbon-helix-helix protein CopG domain-containing protein n=1 Tax=Isoptericola chiayiensis TaxID=579446 RepID=A0ABP8YKB6_9MICO|nr:hypothetical protein [Isoptericola chiayiensis]NOW00568.1 hypothetical protein [Isoptericola chiayiensis]